MKLSTVAVVLLTFFLGCATKAPEVDFQQEGITFKCPQGSDIAPFIAAADQRLGTKRGTISVPPGDYVLGGTTLVGKGHTLKFGAGTIDARAAEWYASLWVDDDSAVVGAGDSTVILEPPGITTIVDAGAERDGGGRGSDNVTIRDFQIKGRGMVLDGFAYAGDIGIGNGTNWVVRNIFFNNSQGNSIGAGYGSQNGNHGSNILISGNRFVGVKTSCVAIVNASHVTVENNDMTGCFAGMDIEPNTPTDVADHFVVRKNVGLSGWIQGTFTGPGDVLDNDISGLAVYNAHGVHIARNSVSSNYIYNTGLMFGGAIDCLVENNTIVDTGLPYGLGGADGIDIYPDVNVYYQWHPATGNVFRKNRIYAVNVGSATIAERVYAGIPEAEANPPDGNTFDSNVLGPAIGLDGSRSPGSIVTTGPNDVLKNNVLK